MAPDNSSTQLDNKGYQIKGQSISNCFNNKPEISPIRHHKKVKRKCNIVILEEYNNSADWQIDN